MHRSVQKIETENAVEFRMNEDDYSLLVNELKKTREFWSRAPYRSVSLSLDAYRSFIESNGRQGIKKLLDYAFCADVTQDDIDYMGL